MSEDNFRARHAAARDCHAFGAAPVSGLIRQEPQDFEVVERLGFEPDGEGEHLLLRVRKTDCNTDWVARQLARSTGVGRAAVSYAGLKDRHAVTTQYFSIHLPGQATPAPDALQGPGYEVLSLARHRRKLRRGALTENAFRIRVRALAGDHEALEARLRLIRVRGCPNFFGPQRYGRNFGNLDLAWRCLVEGRRPGGRERRGLIFSAARSALFDLVLAHRVRLDNWDRFVDGDIAMLEHSRSIFRVDPADSDLEGRLAALDIHPTGPLPGRQQDDARDESTRACLESEALSGVLPLLDGLARHGLDPGRRSLRLVPRELTWRLEDSDLFLDFRLRPGGYATSVIRCLVRDPGPDIA